MIGTQTQRVPLTVDRAAIFATICERNEIRRKARLPLLDVRVEFNHAVGKALDDAYEQMLELIATEFRHRLNLKWIARWQRRKRTDRWPTGMGIALGMGWRCRKVCERILRMRVGIVPPAYNPRHLVRYGAGR